MITREDALNLLKEHIKNDNLLKHCLAVEAGMRAYALRQAQGKLSNSEPLSEDSKRLVEMWSLAGLLHDIDYEEFPDQHPSEHIDEFLKGRDVPEEVLYAIRAHSDNPDYPRKSSLDKALHAVDSISGIIIATALVRPGGFEGMKAKSVSKKIKDKSFAAKMDRERMRLGAEELGVEMSEHLQMVIGALQGISGELGIK